ncbi:MAG: chromosome segregation protein SMC, partial [Acutalibacteraceae bacterium]
ITASIDEIRNKIAVNEQQSADFLSQCAVLKNSIEHNNATIERINKEKGSSEQNRQQLEKEIASEEKLISQIKKIISEKTEKLALVEKQLDKMQTQGGSIEDEASVITKKIADLTKLLSDCRVEFSTAKSSLDEINLRLETISSLSQQKSEAFAQLEKEKKQADAAYEASKEKLVSLTNTVNGLSMIFTKHSEKVQRLKGEIDTAVFENEHLSSKAKMLEDLEKNMEGYSGAVKAVMKESEKGTLKGIEGTVSKLITMKREYALAIETALGAAVQNIVCQSENDAKRAIEFLKRGNFGRATFQPISSVKGKTLSESGFEDCDGFVGVADTLVDCDEKYREIMVSLLGRTVIAEDLDYAVVIAKKYKYHFKIVTLDGQVVNAGGSITGGSQARSAGIISRGLEIERLHQKYQQEKAALEEKKSEYERLLSSLKDEEEKLETSKQLLSSCTQEKIRLEGQKQLVFEQYCAAKQALDELESEKEACKQRISEMNISAEKSQTLLESYESEIQNCESALSSLGEKKEEITRSSEDISQKMSALRLEIHDAQKDLAVRTQSMNLLKARLVEGEDKEKELENEISQINRNSDDLRAQIKDLETRAKNLAQRSEMMKQDIVSLQNERSNFESENGKLRSLEKEKNSERETLSGEKARLEERRNSMQEEYDATINKLYDEYQLTLREAMNETEKTADPVGARKRLAEIKNKIRALGSVNVGAIDEYKEVSERYEFMSTQLSDVEKSKKELTRLIDELTDKMSVQFREKFSKINSFFGETFKELFGGGHAEISLVDPTNVLESEIDIKLQPPGKNVKRLDSLSGGEKGLSAISLLFAILKVNPAPFCIFDEVEAALDDVNVTRYAQYVRRMTSNTQFILITHRRGTMEEADMLYGITMQEQGVSKLLELKTAELASKLGITN